MVIKLQAGWTGFQFTNDIQTGFGASTPLIWWLLVTYQPGNQADHSPAPSAEIMDEWSYTSPSSLWIHAIECNNFASSCTLHIWQNILGFKCMYVKFDHLLVVLCVTCNKITLFIIPVDSALKMRYICWHEKWVRCLWTKNLDETAWKQ
jgi:hypothetical protein